MTPETKVKHRCYALLDKAGAYYFSPVTGGFGRSGVPDIVACVRGRFVAIECKAGTNKPTPLQAQNIRRIGTAEGSALVINETNIEELARLLNEITGTS